MYESEIKRLGLKVKELKKSYETVKMRRENHILKLNSLDNQIDEITKSLEELESKNERNKGIKEIITKDTKRSFIRAGVVILISIILRMIIDICVKKYTYNLTNYIIDVVLPITSIGITFNLLPNFILRIIYYVNFNKTNKSYKFLESQRQEIISKRISLGSKYKDIRETEVMTENIYKEAKNLLFSEIARLYSESDDYKHIDTRDIYHKLMVDESYYRESIENQKKIIDDLLKDYLIEKLIESNFKNINLFIDDLSVEDLFLILLERVPKTNHHEVLSHIIHAILGVSGNMQNYGIVWFQENDEKLINNPEITFDESGRWNELKTHEDTSYDIIFKVVYYTFMNDFMRENQHKRKREK